jgi:hypothetical protein
MKKTLFLFLITALCSQIWAQEFDPLKRGNFLIGGTLSGSYEQKQGLESDCTFDLGIHPTLGYFIFNRFVLGITPSASIVWSKIDPISEYGKAVNLELGPMFRYYFWKKLFISFEPKYLVGNFKSARIDSKTKGYSLNQGLGFDFFIKDNVALEIGYYFYYSKQTVNGIYESQFPYVTDLKTYRSKINFGLQIII